MKRGLETLAKYKRLAETQGVDKLIAVATSAVREASERRGLPRAGRPHDRASGRKAVSGEEEARLIYLAALHSIHLEGRRALVIDIGGGSVELALGAGKRLERARLREARRAAHGGGVRDRRPALAEGRGSAWSRHVEQRVRPARGTRARAGFDVRGRHLGHHPGAGARWR